MVGALLEAGVDKRRIDVLEPGGEEVVYPDLCYLTPQPLIHNVSNCGYHITVMGGERLFYATDTGTLDGIEASGYDLYMVEANHTRAELEARIEAKKAAGEFAYEWAASKNHLSQEQAEDWLYQQMGPNSRYVFLHQHRRKEIRYMEKLLLTRKEAAEALSISVDTLDELRADEKIRSVNIGVRVYFSPDELKAFVTKEGQLC